MSRRKSKISLKELLSAILAFALVLGVVGGCVAISSIDTKTISSTKFKLGDLNAQGAYLESKTAIYTADLFECQGLTVTLDFESDCEYRVYYYRDDKTFIGATPLLKEDYSKEDSYQNARYARIVIYPNLEDKETIFLLNVISYAKQLKIKVDKNQNFEPVLYQAISNIEKELNFASAFPVQINNGPYCYADIKLFENKTIRRIGVPVKLIRDIEEDAEFTVYVISGNGSAAFTKVKEIQLVIPANTFYAKEKVSLEGIDVPGSTYNYLYNHINDEITNYSIIDEWVYFDVNITVGKGETLAFYNEGDDVFFAYHNGLADEETMDMYSKVFTVPILSKDVEIYMDVYCLE